MGCGGRSSCNALTCKRKLCVEPRELAVVQTRFEVNLAFGIRGNLEPIVHRVCRAWRNEADINQRARGPRVAFVDRISVSIDLKGPIEVRTGIDGALSVLGDGAA